MSTIVDSGGYGKVPAWRHARCFLDLGWWKDPVEDLPGWDTLGEDNQKVVKDLVKSTSKSSKTGKLL